MKDKKKKYYTADQDKLMKKMEELGSGDYFKPKEGKNVVRILPPWSDNGLWYKEATLHYGLKNEEGKERGYPCLKMFDKDCPICEKREELLAGSKEDKKVGEKLRARTKFYTNVLIPATGKVMIWGFSQKTLGTLLSYCGDPDYGDISSPEEGFDVIINRTGTGKLDTRYDIRVRPKSSAIDEDSKWADLLKDLDTVVTEVDEGDLEEILELNFGATDSSDDDDEDDEDKPKRKKKDDEDEDDEKEEDEDDEEPRKKKKVKEDDDEDEEDDDDEDEEEEKPRRKKKKKVVDDEDED
jgi:hypothetical protein